MFARAREEGGMGVLMSNGRRASLLKGEKSPKDGCWGLWRSPEGVPSSALHCTLKSG